MTLSTDSALANTTTPQECLPGFSGFGASHSYKAVRYITVLKYHVPM
jgi:hypothetical protein